MFQGFMASLTISERVELTRRRLWEVKGEAIW